MLAYSVRLEFMPTAKTDQTARDYLHGGASSLAASFAVPRIISVNMGLLIDAMIFQWPALTDVHLTTEL